MLFLFSKGALVLAGILTSWGFFNHSFLTGKFDPQVFGAGTEKHKIDLKVDSQCHYYNYDPQNPASIKIGDLNGYVDVGCFFNGNNDQPFGTWTETDLGKEKFFNFSDVKPGDRGEDTISLHVTGDDGCGQIIFRNIKDSGNDCVEPETKTDDPDCKNKTPGKYERNGELREALEFSLWLDQGDIPGFQGTEKDVKEGDNVFNGKDVLFIDWKNIQKCPSVQEIRKHLRLARKLSFEECKRADPDGDGRTGYGVCHGLSRDGRMVESATYYYGLGWRLPKETGNEVQTDSLGFDLAFSVKSNRQCSPCANQCYECDSKCDD